MSNTCSITQWLDHLIDLLPPSAIRLVGAGNGSGIWAQWLAAHGQVAATLVEANPQQFAALQRQQAAGNWGQASLLNTVIAPSAGKVDFFTASLATESGLLPPEELRALWPNVHTVATQPQSATDLAALLQLGAEQSIGPQWLLLDCLPAAALLRSAQAQLPQVDVVVARVLLCATDNAPTLCGMGADLEDVANALPGFQLLALQASRHPALGHALFVRDYRHAAQHASQARDAETQAKQAAQQALAELQQRLEQAQADNANLLKKQELQAQAQQALQADLNKVTQAKEAEAKAKAELQTQLTAAQASNAELIKKQELQTQAQQALQADLHKVTQVKEAETKAKAELQAKYQNLQAEQQETNRRQQLLEEEIHKAEVQLKLLEELLLEDEANIEPGNENK